MERKSKAMAALACVALLVLIGAGCARCTMVHSGQQDQPGQEQGETASVDDPNATIVTVTIDGKTGKISAM